MKHHAMLEQEHCIDLFLPADRKQEVADDMLERFCNTFLEQADRPESEVSYGYN